MKIQAGFASRCWISCGSKFDLFPEISYHQLAVNVSMNHLDYVSTLKRQTWNSETSLAKLRHVVYQVCVMKHFQRELKCKWFLFLHLISMLPRRVSPWTVQRASRVSCNRLQGIEGTEINCLDRLTAANENILEKFFKLSESGKAELCDRNVKVAINLRQSA